MSYTLPEIAKAVIGAAVAGLGVAITSLEDNVIVTAEWLGIIATTLTALGAIFAVPNKQPESEVVDGYVPQHREEGESALGIVVVVLVIVLLVLLILRLA